MEKLPWNNWGSSGRKELEAWASKWGEKPLEALHLTDLARDGWDRVLLHRCFKSQIRLPPTAAPRSPMQLSWLLQPYPISIHLAFATCFRVLWAMAFISYQSANHPKEGTSCHFFPYVFFFNFYFLHIRTWEKKMLYWNTAMFCCSFKVFLWVMSRNAHSTALKLVELLKPSLWFLE